ncbi:MAG: dihydropteroate synthase [Alphaproteobacteria bacterium]|jgi:dihydropteroate synthase|nr:dihydropteroate synthase [Alphaproteobacteria bacterium]
MGGRALAVRIRRHQGKDLMRAEVRAKRDAFLLKLKARPAVMGILNLTPDSFSDGGRFQAFDAAIAHAKSMVVAGCDIVDIGGESTRPAATPVTEAEELARVGDVLRALTDLLDVPLSIDTSKAAVAARAIEMGAAVINDVWGLQKDPDMAAVAAETEVALIIMHNRKEKDERVDIFADIRRFFDRSLALAAKAGIPEEVIILDPGIGFGKTSRQNVEAVARIPDLKDYGLPILVGASRKAFLGSLTGDGIEATLIGTVAANLVAAAAGASIFRVHDVAEHVAALRIFHSMHGNVTR